MGSSTLDEVPIVAKQEKVFLVVRLICVVAIDDCLVTAVGYGFISVSSISEQAVVTLSCVARLRDTPNQAIAGGKKVPTKLAVDRLPQTGGEVSTRCPGRDSLDCNHEVRARTTGGPCLNSTAGSADATGTADSDYQHCRPPEATQNGRSAPGLSQTT